MSDLITRYKGEIRRLRISNPNLDTVLTEIELTYGALLKSHGNLLKENAQLKTKIKHLEYKNHDLTYQDDQEKIRRIIKENTF